MKMLIGFVKKNKALAISAALFLLGFALMIFKHPYIGTFIFLIAAVALVISIAAFTVKNAQGSLGKRILKGFGAGVATTAAASILLGIGVTVGVPDSALTPDETVVQQVETSDVASEIEEVVSEPLSETDTSAEIVFDVSSEDEESTAVSQESSESKTNEITSSSIDATSSKSAADDLSSAALDNFEFIEQYKYNIVTSAKLTLDKYIDDYKISLAPQNWTIAKFDETDTVIARTEITYKGVTGNYYYVATLNIEDGEVKSATPHFVSALDVILDDDGYCDNVFNKIASVGSNAGSKTESKAEIPQATTYHFILNEDTKKFHIDSCNDVDKIAPENFNEIDITDENFSDAVKRVESMGYSPCGHCLK